MSTPKNKMDLDALLNKARRGQRSQTAPNSPWLPAQIAARWSRGEGKDAQTSAWLPLARWGAATALAICAACALITLRPPTAAPEFYRLSGLDDAAQFTE